MKETKSGFTLLEVVLVVAISTLLFMSVTIGVGSRIASGRYKTAGMEIVDYLRDVYTAALNTENDREGIEGARTYCTVYGAEREGETTGKLSVVNKQEYNENGAEGINMSKVEDSDLKPGRTNCAIYGKALYFGANDGRVHVFDVVGDVVTNNVYKENGKETTELKQIENKSVLEQLEYVRADIFAAVWRGENLAQMRGSSNCRISPAGEHTTYEPNWGALFKTANFGGNTGREATDDFIGMVMIVRAPASGNVHTFFYERPEKENWGFLATSRDENGGWLDVFDDNSNNGVSCETLKSGSFEYEEDSPVKLIEAQQNLGSNEAPKNTGFCIGSDDFYVAIANLKKYVEFIPGGQNASSIKLNESSDKQENPCYDGVGD